MPTTESLPPYPFSQQIRVDDQAGVYVEFDDGAKVDACKVYGKFLQRTREHGMASILRNVLTASGEERSHQLVVLRAGLAGLIRDHYREEGCNGPDISLGILFFNQYESDGSQLSQLVSQETLTVAQEIQDIWQNPNLADQKSHLFSNLIEELDAQYLVGKQEGPWIEALIYSLLNGDLDAEARLVILTDLIFKIFDNENLENDQRFKSRDETSSRALATLIEQKHQEIKTSDATIAPPPTTPLPAISPTTAPPQLGLQEIRTGKEAIIVTEDEISQIRQDLATVADQSGKNINWEIGCLSDDDTDPNDTRLLFLKMLKNLLEEQESDKGTINPRSFLSSSNIDDARTTLIKYIQEFFSNFPQAKSIDILTGFVNRACDMLTET